MMASRGRSNNFPLMALIMDDGTATIPDQQPGCSEIRATILAIDAVQSCMCSHYEAESGAIAAHRQHRDKSGTNNGMLFVGVLAQR